MKWYHFWLLGGFIFMAPHLTKQQGVWPVLVCTVIGIVAAVRNE